jgi:hypothetical protein
METIMQKFVGVPVVYVLLLGWTPLPAAAQVPIGDYYPLKVGTKWHYRVEANGQVGSLVNQIAKTETIDGQLLARLETSARGQVVASEHLASNDKGIFRHRINGLEISPPLCLIKNPIKEGESWVTDVKIGAERAKMACRVAREEVTVPAGKYKAVVVTIETEQAGQKISSIYWFAAGVGVVQQKIDIGGNKVNLELEKFEAGK